MSSWDSLRILFLPFPDFDDLESLKEYWPSICIMFFNWDLSIFSLLDMSYRFFFGGGRDATEVPFFSHCMKDTLMSTTEANNPQQAETVFPFMKFFSPTLHTVPLGRKSICRAYTWGWRLMFYLLEGQYTNINYFTWEIYLFSPFIFSIVSIHQHGIQGIYLTLGVIIQYYSIYFAT